MRFRGGSEVSRLHIQLPKGIIPMADNGGQPIPGVQQVTEAALNCAILERGLDRIYSTTPALPSQDNNSTSS